MYCPQCGGTNEESARFCSTCGMDLDKYRKEWRDPGAQSAGPTAESATGGTAAGEWAGHQQPGSQPPPYQQQYPQQYQPEYRPTYQAAPYYQSTPSYGAVPRVPSYMGWAIATLILCFWPTGIVAVVYASQVGNKLSVGDVAGAQASSRKAKIWCWVTFGIGVAAVAIAIIGTMLVAATSINIY